MACAIGVALIGANYPVTLGLFGPPSSYPNAISAASANSNPWQAKDGAWQPAIDLAYGTSTATGRHAWAAMQATGANGFLAGRLKSSSTPETITYYRAASYSDSFASFTPANIFAYSSAVGERAGWLAIDPDIGTTYNYLLLDAYSSLAYARYDSNYLEATPTKCQIMPNNQELVSYKRAQTAPTATEVKTMDGAIRRYITSPAGYNVSATWRWSDNGTTAANLAAILKEAMANAYPLIVYIPAGIYYDGAHLDLVVPTSDPAVTMPAPGVYELTIEGSCQP